MQRRNRVHLACERLGYLAWMVLTGLVLAMQPAGAQASTLTILSPAAGDEIRGDGTDLKNVVRFSTLQPSDFGYYVDISEVDQDAPTHPAIGSPVSITVLATDASADGNHTFSFPFDFNRPELAGMGSGLFRMTLRSVAAATVTTSAPVLYFKGRPAPSLVMNADDPFLLKCSASAGDPDASPDYEYTFHFVRTRDREEVATVSQTTSAASLTQADLELPALEDWEDYDVTLKVTDSLNRMGAVGQGLTGQTTIHVHANAGPIVSLSGLSDGAVFQAQKLPYVVTFGAMAIDDAPGSITLQADVDGDGIPEAEATVSNYASASLSVPVRASRVETISVRGIDDKGQAGPYTTKRIRVNTPPNISIDPKLMQLKGGNYLPVQLVATDTFSDRITVELSLDGNGQPAISQDVDSNITTTLFVPVSGVSVPHTLLARAKDGDGAFSAFVKRTIQPKTPPTLTILSPADGTGFNTSATLPVGMIRTIKLQVLAHDEYFSTLQVFIDLDGDGLGELSYQIDSDTPTTLSLNIPSLGLKTLSAWAVDVTGFNGVQSAVTKFNFVMNEFPTVRAQLSPGGSVMNVDGTFPYFTAYLYSGLTDKFGRPDSLHWNFFDGTTADTSQSSYITHDYASLGLHQASVKATDIYGASSAESLLLFRLNDQPQALLQAFSPGYEDTLFHRYVIQRDQETSFALRAYNMERDDYPLRLKVTFEVTDIVHPPKVDYSTLVDPPADKNVPHIKDIIVRHTYHTTRDFNLRFDVGERISNTETTTTRYLLIHVVDPPVNATASWDSYK